MDSDSEDASSAKAEAASCEVDEALVVVVAAVRCGRLWLGWSRSRVTSVELASTRTMYIPCSMIDDLAAATTLSMGMCVGVR